MNTFLQFLDRISAQILDPLKRFPLATFSAFIFLLITSIKLSFNGHPPALNEYDNVMEKIAVLSFFGFFFLLALKLISRNFILPMIGVVLLIAIYFYLPEYLRDYISNEEGKIIYPMILGGLFSLMIVAPFITYRASNREFFEWLKQFFYAILLAILGAVVLFLSFQGVMQVVSGLFGLDYTFRQQYVQYSSLFSFAFFAPFLFLALLPKEPRGLAIQAYNKIGEISFKYILSGLFITYFIIIYAYLFKMIFLLEYPNGIVSINIIAFSALAIMTYLFWTPLWNEKNSKYKKVIWIAILLQLILLAIALYLRVDAYGWTFSRLLFASVGLWLFGLSLYALIKKEVSFRGIFLALPLIIIVNLLFSSTISQHSQQKKLSQLLSTDISLSDDTNLSLRYNISNTISYLHDNYGTDALFPLMPQIVNEYNQQEDEVVDNCAIPKNNTFPSFATDKLGFKYVDKWEWKQEVNRVVYKGKDVMAMKRFIFPVDLITEGMEVANYDWIVNFIYHKSETFAMPLVCEPNTPYSKTKLYTVTTKNQKIVIEKEKKVLSEINIENFIKEIIKLGKDNNHTNVDDYYNNTFTEDEFTHIYENDVLSIKLIFNSIGFSSKDDLINYRGLILIREKNIEK